MLFLKNIGPFQLILSMDMQTYMDIRPFLGTCVGVCVYVYCVYQHTYMCTCNFSHLYYSVFFGFPKYELEDLWDFIMVFT